jgi:hypothetical protein
MPENAVGAPGVFTGTGGTEAGGVSASAMGATLHMSGEWQHTRRSGLYRRGRVID